MQSTVGQERSKQVAAPPKKELQKSTPKIAKEYIDTRWPKVYFIHLILCVPNSCFRTCLTICQDFGECNVLMRILKLPQKTTHFTWTLTKEIRRLK